MAEWRSSFILTAKVFRVIPICTFFCAQSSRWLADPALSGFDRKIKASNFGFRKLRAKGNWCPIRSLFLFIFGLFQTLIPNFYNKLCENCPSSAGDLNPNPSEHESPPITNRTYYLYMTLWALDVAQYPGRAFTSITEFESSGREFLFTLLKR